MAMLRLIASRQGELLDMELALSAATKLRRLIQRSRNVVKERPERMSALLLLASRDAQKRREERRLYDRCGTTKDDFLEIESRMGRL